MKSLDYGKGAPPLYMQIYQDLKEKIAGKEYEYGQTLPTEAELQEHYGVSRITIRQAFSSLEQEGLVVRTRGKGTIVARQQVIEELLTSIKSFTEEMRERNMAPGTKFAQCSQTEADEELAELFSCKVGDPLYHIRRVRTANDRVIVLFDTYLSGKAELPLEDSRYYGSLYQLLEDCGMHPPGRGGGAGGAGRYRGFLSRRGEVGGAPPPVGIEERFEAIVADEELAEALALKPGAPIMRRTRIAFDNDLNVQEYTRSFYDASRYAYVVYAGVTDKPGGAADQ